MMLGMNINPIMLRRIDMSKNLDNAIGIIQNELISVCDEFYSSDKSMQKEISTAWNLILKRLNDHNELGDWYNGRI